MLDYKAEQAGCIWRIRTPIPLSPRETQVVQLIVDGHSNKAIADLLDITPHTAKFHVNNVVQKLSPGGTRTNAAVWALRLGLAQFPEQAVTL